MVMKELGELCRLDGDGYKALKNGCDARERQCELDNEYESAEESFHLDMYEANQVLATEGYDISDSIADAHDERLSGLNKAQSELDAAMESAVENTARLFSTDEAGATMLFEKSETFFADRRGWDDIKARLEALPENLRIARWDRLPAYYHDPYICRISDELANICPDREIDVADVGRLFEKASEMECAEVPYEHFRADIMSDFNIHTKRSLGNLPDFDDVSGPDSLSDDCGLR